MKITVHKIIFASNAFDFQGRLFSIPTKAKIINSGVAQATDELIFWAIIEEKVKPNGQST